MEHLPLDVQSVLAAARSGVFPLEDAIEALLESADTHGGIRIFLPFLHSAGADNAVYATIRALGRKRDPSAIDPLLRLLDHDPKDGLLNVRDEWVTRAIAEIGTPVAVASLIHVLDAGPVVAQEQAAEALGACPDGRAVPSLCAFLERSTSVAAARTLGIIGDRRAVKSLVAALAENRSSQAAEAATALGKIGDPTAVPALLLHIAIHGRGRAEAVSALEELGSSSALAGLANRLGAELAQQGAGYDYSGSCNEIRGVAEAISALSGDEESDDYFLSMLYAVSVTCRSHQALRQAIDSFPRSSLAQELTELLRVRRDLEGASPARVLQAWTLPAAVDVVLSLALMDDEDAVDALLSMIGKRISQNDIVAAVNEELKNGEFPLYLLRRLADPRTFDAYAEAFAENGEGLYGSTYPYYVFADIDRERAVNKLLELARTEGPDYWIIEPLAQIAGKRALSTFLGWLALDDLHDFGHEIRITALQWLEDLVDPSDAKTCEALLRETEHESWEVRVAAASTLGMLGVPRGVDVLIEALSSGKTLVITSAAHALSRIGDRRALPVLLQLIEAKEEFEAEEEFETEGETRDWATEAIREAIVALSD